MAALFSHFHGRTLILESSGGEQVPSAVMLEFDYVGGGANRGNVVLFSARNTNSHGWNITGIKWQITSSSYQVNTIHEHDLRTLLEPYFG